MAFFFKNLFAQSGSKATIPETLQGDGSVSYEEGWGFDYQRDKSTDPQAKVIPRDKENGLLYKITGAIQTLQVHGYPDFITTADNGGAAFPYDNHSYVRWNDGAGADVYESLVDNNTSLPSDATKWRRVRPVSGIPTGAGMDFHGASLPDTWLWADGKTIGGPSSGATGRDNLDAFNLFVLLWNSQSNAVLPIQDNTGAPSTRGGSATADWSANKRLPVPDKRGKVSAGKDDLGGTAANILTLSTAQGVQGNVLGAVGGEQAHQLAVEELAKHLHGIQTYTSQGGRPTVGTGTFSPEGYSYSAEAGNDAPHNNVQPTLICNYIIKL